MTGRTVWELHFTRDDSDGRPNDYSAHVYGPPPIEHAATWRTIPDGVRNAAQYDGLVNGARSVSYAVAHLADVTDVRPNERATAGALTTLHAETITGYTVG